MANASVEPLRLWVDAQLPPLLARWLARQPGVTAQHLADLGWLAYPDRALFVAATAARAVIVTKDQDFVQLREREAAGPAILWVTLGNVRNGPLLSAFEGLWPRAAALLRAGEQLVELTESAT